jgi:hypothetical protein
MHDGIHWIVTMKCVILTQFYCMKTHNRPNRKQISMQTTNNQPSPFLPVHELSGCLPKCPVSSTCHFGIACAMVSAKTAPRPSLQRFHGVAFVEMVQSWRRHHGIAFVEMMLSLPINFTTALSLQKRRRCCDSTLRQRLPP